MRLHALVIGTMRLHDDVDATVFLALRVVGAFGFANGLDRDVGRERHAGIGHGIHDGLRTTLGQRSVGVRRTDGVGVGVDLDVGDRILAEEVAGIGHRRGFALTDLGAAGVEVDRSLLRADILRNVQRFEIGETGADRVEEAVERSFGLGAMLGGFFRELDAFLTQRQVGVEIRRIGIDARLDVLSRAGLVASLVQVLEQIAEIAFIGLVDIRLNVRQVRFAVRCGARGDGKQSRAEQREFEITVHGLKHPGTFT